MWCSLGAVRCAVVVVLALQQVRRPELLCIVLVSLALLWRRTMRGGRARSRSVVAMWRGTGDCWCVRAPRSKYIE